MKDERIIIPESFLLVVDDVGWWLEADKRYYVKIPDSALGLWHRPYCFEDYRSLVEIGKALDMRVLCGFTIGEWDRDRVLASVPNSNKYGSRWTNAEVLRDTKRLEEVRDYVNSNPEYIEMAVHGLNHMYWNDETGECAFAEYYQRVDGKNIMLPPDVMRAHLDAWFKIYERNGFCAKVDKLIPCCFFYNCSNGDGEMSYILKDYGIKFISTPFGPMGYDTPKKPTMAYIENGILTTDRTADLSPWYEIDAKVPDVLKSSYYGTHWPHFIAQNPEDNMKTAERWISYFKQYKNKFDVISARNHEMGARQTFYRRFTKMTATSENTFALDFSDVDAQGAPVELIGKEIYLNLKNPYTPLSPDGSAEIELYSVANDFCTYKLTRGGRVANIKINN